MHLISIYNTWNNLDDNVKKHYKNWLELHPDKGKDEQYWQSTEGLHGLSKDDLKRIIEGKYTTSSSLTVYIEEHLKKQANAFLISAGFIDMEVTRSVIEYEQKRQNQVNFESGREKEMEDILYQALMPVFCKSLVFIPLHHGDSSHYTLLLIDTINSCFYHMNSMRPEETISESHNFHFENAKFVVKYINGIMERVLEREVEMTDMVKETRRWILDKKINGYELVDSVSCPQQDKTSTDCGPFMLYFIEEVMTSTESSKLTKGGEDMRRKMLHVFAHLNDEAYALMGQCAFFCSRLVESLKGGFSFVIRDSLCTLVACGAGPLASLISAEHAELLACCKAVDFHPSIIETDAMEVKRQLDAANMPNTSTLGRMYEDLCEKMAEGGTWKVTYANRRINTAAHLLAAHACSWEQEKFYFSVPDIIQAAIAADYCRF
ncbi:uncharacterized protein LOC126803234 [Argentina anserina]|uniref:uncharacterized protein LOC126803234 n=1 Tax=Argentina anserina TaxID=57926 RepID=UPI00217669BE|nr:uncharacterized protein LOC126803234 [Potentilla anserina]